MNENRMNKTDEVLRRMREAQPALFERAEVVGVWVWLSFDSIPSSAVRDFLKAEGFIWNRKRSAWQHCGGVFRHHAHHNPKEVYGVIQATLLEAEVA